MRINGTHVATIAIIAWAGGLGCKPPRPSVSRRPSISATNVDNVPNEADSSPSLTIQKDSVEVFLRANHWFEVDIPFQLRNPIREALGLPGCRIPNGPFIETLQNSTWHRWALEYDLCDSPPHYVEPRSTRVDTLHLSGCFQLEHCSPAWLGDSSATLRLVYRVYPTSERIKRSSQLSRLPYIDLPSKPFKAVIVYRPCRDQRAPRGLLC